MGKILNDVIYIIGSHYISEELVITKPLTLGTNAECIWKGYNGGANKSVELTVVEDLNCKKLEKIKIDLMVGPNGFDLVRFVTIKNM